MAAWKLVYCHLNDTMSDYDQYFLNLSAFKCFSYDEPLVSNLSVENAH